MYQSNIDRRANYEARLDHSDDYAIRLDAIAHAGRSPGRWGRRFWLTIAATLGVWSLTLPAGQALGLGVVAFAFMLWALIPHVWILGDPLPPELMPPPDPDTARIKLASRVCWWAGLFGGSDALLWARIPLAMELERRDRLRHPERPRPRTWLCVLVPSLVMLGLMIWAGAWLITNMPPPQ
jgi:hypothetical protein